jgi:hypothetical protein
LEREEFERKQQAELERPKKVKKNKKEEDDWNRKYIEI